MSITLTIEKLIYGGDGLARIPATDRQGRGKAVFVPFVLEGEQAEVTVVEERPGFARARLEKITVPSPRRVQPLCPYFARCGGCHYQHASYEDQLAIKATIFKETLRRTAKLALEEVLMHPSPPWNYRNRTRMRVRSAPEVVIGYSRMGTHDLLPIEQCPISSPLINRAIAALWTLGRRGGIPGDVLEATLFANHDDSSLLLELQIAAGTPTNRAARVMDDQLAPLLPELVGVTATHQSRYHQQEEPAVSRSGSLTYATGAGEYDVSSGSFFQINRFLTDNLVELGTGGQKGKSALDLYAGVGLFSVPLAKNFERVVAVEESPIAHADLRHNVPAHVKAVHASAEEYLQQARGRLDLVVADPPRSGLGLRVARELARLRPARVVYISCDPATLSRDLRVLLESGYRLEAAHLIDLFPQTFHIESVVHLAA